MEEANNGRPYIPTMSATANADESEAEEQETEQFSYFPQVTQHPTTAIEGEIVELVTGADIDSNVEDTGSSFGVVIEDPEVVGGSLWKNRNIPDGFESASEFNDTLRLAIEGTDIDYIRGREVTEELVSDARETMAEYVDDIENADYDEHKVGGTDYKVADSSDRDASVQEVSGETLGIDVGGGVFESKDVDAFDSDRIMVWYGGMSGQFIGRGLDFNGMPFARYTNPDDDELPYLVKGLFQVPIGWRGDADIEQFDSVPTTDRTELATDYGRPPRVARPPVLRDDIDGRAFIAIGRYNGSDMFEVHVGRATDDYDELMNDLRSGDLTEDDYDALDMKYDQSAEETLNSKFDNPSEVFSLYHGEGWQDEPEETASWAEGSSNDGGSFDTPDVDIDGETVDHPTEQEVEFAQNIAEKLAGTGVSPDNEIFPVEDQDENVDLAGLIEHNTDQFSVTPDEDSIREVVYENTAHLTEDDL